MSHPFRRASVSGCGGGQLGLEGQHLVGGRDQVLRATADDVGQVMAEAEPQELVADELPRGQAAALFRWHLPRPAHQLEGDHVGVGLRVGRALAQHVPHDDEQLPRDGDDRLVLVHAAGGRHNCSNSAFQYSLVATALQAASTIT